MFRCNKKIIKKKLFNEACYSVKDDINCRSNNKNDPADQIFWKRDCMDINTICSSLGFNNLVGWNASFCLNQTTNSEIPLQSLLNRKLASQEFFE